MAESLRSIGSRQGAAARTSAIERRAKNYAPAGGAIYKNGKLVGFDQHHGLSAIVAHERKQKEARLR